MSRHRYKFGGYKRASVWSLELCSTAVYSGTGRENATLRTETASPSCSQGRPGARPWLCSWEEVHIAIPENGTPSTTPAGPPGLVSVWSDFHRAKTDGLHPSSRKILSVTGKAYLNVGGRRWAMSLDRFLRHEPDATVPDFRRLRRKRCMFSKTHRRAKLSRVSTNYREYK